MTLSRYGSVTHLTSETITEIAAELVNIMKLLHEPKPVIIHPDIKTKNIINRNISDSLYVIIYPFFDLLLYNTII